LDDQSGKVVCCITDNGSNLRKSTPRIWDSVECQQHFRWWGWGQW